MFRTGSPYSQFFMSGLLPSADPNASEDGQDGFLYEVDFRRRGSLPDTLSPTANLAQFHKERSFLSLDLAGAGSLRAPSLHTLHSRPSLQSLPTQKPMPNYAYVLPALPAPNVHSRASSTLLPTTQQSHPVAGPSKPVAASNLTRNMSVKTATSTVSTNYRRTKRSDALARLEGRSPAAAALKPFRFGGIKEESTSNFMSLSDDEDSSEDEWDMSDEDTDFVDLEIDFSSNRHSYSAPSQRDDEEDIFLPFSPTQSHTYPRSLSLSTSSHSAPSRMQRRRSRTHSNSGYGLGASSVKSEPRRMRSKTVSMFPSNGPRKEYTSFMDFDNSTHRDASSSSMSRRFSWSSSKNVASPLPSPTPRKTDEWLQWSSFIEISSAA
ncbi:hypothetical protein C8R42DRAFT_643959 [Lentinula raphanica]|nr:hypothetical protein C8R42DRAFT_643959 [Lentinula raphanica]